jgi:hypothetical protein
MLASFKHLDYTTDLFLNESYVFFCVNTYTQALINTLTNLYTE